MCLRSRDIGGCEGTTDLLKNLVKGIECSSVG